MWESSFVCQSIRRSLFNTEKRLSSSFITCRRFVHTNINPFQLAYYTLRYTLLILILFLFLLLLCREKLVNELCNFFVIDKVRSVLEQFKEGLSTLNFLYLIEAHVILFEEIFYHQPTPLTAEAMDQLFIPQYVEKGSRLRNGQEVIVMHKRDYLLDCEGLQETQSCCCTCHTIRYYYWVVRVFPKKSSPISLFPSR